MPSPTEPERCRKCGAETTTEGLCAACLLEVGLTDEGEDGSWKKGEMGALPPRFGDYEILDEIARGGMGVVYKARQKSLNRIVAVKMVLAGKLARHSDLRRFRVEAETAARLQHSNIVSIHEVGEFEGQPFFSMDYVEGESLAELAHNDPLPAKRAAIYLKIIAEAVQYAHSKGVLHRDLKPSNILIDQNDQPRITDFGLAKRLDDAALSTPHSPLTVTGQILGSPNFMPPEQARGEKAGPASDVYSLGAILYQLITGRPPFMAETLTLTLRLVAETEPVSPRLLNPSVPRDLETICLKCLQKEPQRRYGTAQGMADDLDRFLRDEPIQARPVRQGEKLWRWGRRNTALAATTVSALVLLAAVVIGSPFALVRINGERKRAEENGKNEAAQRLRAERLAQENSWNLYAARIKIAEQAITEGNPQRAKQLLSSLGPESGQADLRSFDWFYLWRRFHSEALTIPAGDGRSLALSADGRWLATVSAHSSILRLRNPTNGVEIFQLTGHTGNINQVAFAPSSDLIASAGDDGTVRVWQCTTGKSKQILRAGTNAFATLAFSPDGRLLAAGEGTRVPSGGNPSARYAPQSTSGRLVVWNVGSGTLERIVQAHHSGVLSMAFLPDSRRLVSSGIDFRVLLTDCASGEILARRTNESGHAFALACLPAGQEIAEASWLPHLESGEITILDGSTLTEKRTFGPSVGKVLCLAVSPDGTKIASAGADCIARIWEADGKSQPSVLSAHSDVIRAIVFGAGGRTLATSGRDAVRVWDVNNESARQRIRTQNSYSVEFSPDGKLLACGGRAVEIRDASSGALLRILPGYTNFDVRVSFSPDGSVLKAAGWEGEDKFWKVQDWSPINPADPQQAPFDQFAFSPDGRTLATCVNSSVIRFWDAQTLALKDIFTNLTANPWFFGFAQDDSFLTFEGTDLHLWDLKTKHVLRQIPGMEGMQLSFSGDGKWLSLSWSAQEIRLFKMPEIKLHASLRGHRDMAWARRFSHDSRLFATGSWDGTVKIWHVLSGQELLSISSQAGVVWSVAFAPNDRKLAFGCGQNAPDTGEVVIMRGTEDDPISSHARLVELGVEQAQQGRWDEASSAFARALEADPTDRGLEAWSAATMAAAGDNSGYQKSCRKIQVAFHERAPASASSAEQVAKACLLLPNRDVDFRLINQWVELASRVEPNTPLSGLYENHIAGLAAYRQADYQMALQKMNLVLSNTNGIKSILLSGWMVKAMAQKELGQETAAQESFAKGLEFDRLNVKKLWIGGIENEWNDWIAGQCLLSEAKRRFNTLTH